MTLTLSIQYGALVLYPASHDGDPFRSFVYNLTLLGLTVAFVTELAFYGYRPSWGSRRQIGVHRAGTIALVGSAALLYGVRLGLGVYGFGVTAGLKHASHIASLVTPLQSWPTVGIVLAIYAYRDQAPDRRWIWFYIATTLSLNVIVAFLSASTALLYPLFLAVGVSAVLAGMVRVRIVILAIVALIVVWPVLYHIRNQGRIAAGATSYAFATTADAQARIEFDRLMANARLAHEEDLTIPGLPGYALIVRSGLVPRFLDSNRPVIQTSTLISEARGGDGTSSDTFTTFGEIWLLHGYGGFILTNMLVTALAALVIRHRGPLAFVVLAAIVVNLLNAEAAFPDAIAGAMQYVVSAIVAIAVLRPVRRRTVSPPGPAALIPRTFPPESNRALARR